MLGNRISPFLFSLDTTSTISKNSPDQTVFFDIDFPKCSWAHVVNRITLVLMVLPEGSILVHNSYGQDFSRFWSLFDIMDFRWWNHQTPSMLRILFLGRWTIRPPGCHKVVNLSISLLVIGWAIWGHTLHMLAMKPSPVTNEPHLWKDPIVSLSVSLFFFFCPCPNFCGHPLQA